VLVRSLRVARLVKSSTQQPYLNFKLTHYREPGNSQDVVMVQTSAGTAGALARNVAQKLFVRKPSAFTDHAGEGARGPNKRSTFVRMHCGRIEGD